MNEFDSERIEFILKQNSYSSTPLPDNADLIIFNTCSVRKKAEDRLYGHIGNLKSIKEKNPQKMIIVAGCTAQSLGKKILQDFSFVDIILGTGSIDKLPELIEGKTLSGESLCSIAEFSGSFERIYDLNRRYRFKAFLPISIGCNNYCSYCIVPYVRGRERSVEPEKIINAIEELVADGMIEVMLLGQNVNSYGSDFKTTNKNYDFSRLLDEVAMIDGLKRIRFMTSHPKDFKKNIVDAIKRNENIMHHIHLPLQAGSDKILGLMNRKYTRDEYIGVYKHIKDRIPDCAVTTDIIVGFPGESERDFEQTLDIIERLRFNRAFTFIYSPRNGTEAANLYKNNCVSIPEKQVRFDRLLNLQNAISLEENRKFLGKKVRVLVEGKSKRKAGQFEGRLDNNLIVNFESKKDLAGRLINIKVVKATPFYLIGEDPGNES